MENRYDDVLSFKGTWRNYQKRVLDQAEMYLQDGKVHIVAAPGAGKTTLGIELIRRIGKPCLILSPRIVIRQQWLERIRESFLHREEEGLLSHDIRRPGLITSLTYQTLFFGMTRGSGVEEDADGADKEEVDFSDFPFVQKIKEAGIGTVCLDECHHLKSEWWKALENFMKEMEGVTVVSLTATPPYDSTPAQWERYLAMCGPIDAEITIPELVKEGSLCPHQDYVWFNYPTGEEEKEIRVFHQAAEEAFLNLMEDAGFQMAAASHKALNDYENSCDSMLENPAYLSALLIYCKEKEIPFDGRWMKVLTVKELPPMSERWMGILLQGFLFEDKEEYSCSGTYREDLERRLKAAGLIHQRKVNFLVNDKVEKLFINSRGKLESICRIADVEYGAMGEDLRMLILTDYIRKEYRSSLGNESRDIQSIGVLPVFELLRRQEKQWKLGVMCGSLMVIPDTAKEAFCREVKKESPSLKASLRPLKDDAGRTLGYSEAVMGGKLQIYTRVMTRLFEEGWFQILVGTKSLLGEGWDAPCINSLIMASFVGSFVLGNQMRGRAIRTDDQTPDKVSNIWHLVCLAGSREKKERRLLGEKNPELTEDFHTLQRRMEGIMGLSYSGQTIENGTDRLTIVRPPWKRRHVEEINEEMAVRAANRGKVAADWKKAVSLYEQMEDADQVQADREYLKTGVTFLHLLALQLLLLSGELINVAVSLTRSVGTAENIGFYLGTILFFLLFLSIARKILRICTPMRFFRTAAKGVHRALREDGQITSDSEVMTEEGEGIFFAAWLKGGTKKEKALFADALEELLSPVDNQRYLLCQGRKGKFPRRYYCVPKVFAGSREKAEFFLHIMKSFLGNAYLVYTRNPKGREILLRARAKAFANRNERRMQRKRKIKSALE